MGQPRRGGATRGGATEGIEIIVSQTGRQVHVIDGRPFILRKKSEQLLVFVDLAKAGVDGVILLSGQTGGQAVVLVRQIAGCSASRAPRGGF